MAGGNGKKNKKKGYFIVMNTLPDPIAVDDYIVGGQQTVPYESPRIKGVKITVVLPERTVEVCREAEPTVAMHLTSTALAKGEAELDGITVKTIEDDSTVTSLRERLSAMWEACAATRITTSDDCDKTSKSTGPQKDATCAPACDSSLPLPKPLAAAVSAPILCGHDMQDTPLEREHKFVCDPTQIVIPAEAGADATTSAERPSAVQILTSAWGSGAEGQDERIKVYVQEWLQGDEQAAHLAGRLLSHDIALDTLMEAQKVVEGEAARSVNKEKDGEATRTRAVHGVTAMIRLAMQRVVQGVVELAATVHTILMLVALFGPGRLPVNLLEATVMKYEQGQGGSKDEMLARVMGVKASLKQALKVLYAWGVLGDSSAACEEDWVTVQPMVHAFLVEALRTAVTTERQSKAKKQKGKGRCNDTIYGVGVTKKNQDLQRASIEAVSVKLSLAQVAKIEKGAKTWPQVMAWLGSVRAMVAHWDPQSKDALHEPAELRTAKQDFNWKVMFVAAQWCNTFGEPVEAAELLRLSLGRALHLDEPAPCLRQVLMAMCSTATALHTLMALDTARTLLELALRFISGFPNQDWVTLLRCEALGTLGVVQGDQGDYEAALATLSAAANQEAERYGWGSAERATTLEHIGRIQGDLSHLKPAKQTYEELLRIYRELHTEASVEYSSALGALAAVHFDQGNFELSRTAYEDSIRLSVKAVGETARETAQLQHNLGLYHCELGEFAAARRCLEGALEVRQGLGDIMELGATRTCMGILCKEDGDTQSAREHLEAALELEAQAEPLVEGHVVGCSHLAAVAQHHLGLVDRLEGYYAMARRRLEVALAIQELNFGEMSHNRIETLSELSVAMAHQGEFEGAHRHLSHAMAVIGPLFGTTSFQMATALHWLGVVLHAEGENEEAKVALEQALQIRTGTFGTGSHHVAITLRELANVLITIGQEDAAKSALARVLQVQEKVFVGPHAERVLGATRKVVARLGKGVDLEASGDWEVMHAGLKQRFDDAAPEGTQDLSKSGGWEEISPPSPHVGEADNDWHMVPEQPDTAQP